MLPLYDRSHAIPYYTWGGGLFLFPIIITLGNDGDLFKASEQSSGVQLGITQSWCQRWTGPVMLVHNDTLLHTKRLMSLTGENEYVRGDPGGQSWMDEKPFVGEGSRRTNHTLEEHLHTSVDNLCFHANLWILKKKTACVSKKTESMANLLMLWKADIGPEGQKVTMRCA